MGAQRILCGAAVMAAAAFMGYSAHAQYQNDGDIQVLGIPGFTYLGPGQALPDPPTNITAVGGCSFTTSIHNLLLYYPLDEDDLGPVQDESGNGHNGLESLADFNLSGAIGTGFDFDGTASKIVLNNTTNFSFNHYTDFTLATWIRPDGLGNEGLNGSCIIGMGSSVPGFWRLDLHHGQEGQLSLRMGIENYQETTVEAPLPGYQAGNWIHVAAVRDAVADEVILYANGAPFHIGTDTTGASWSSTTGDIQVGNFILWPEQAGFSGGIDEVRVYNRALSSTEVSNLYTAAFNQPTITFDETTSSNACSFTTIRRWSGTDSCSVSNYEDQWIFQAFSNGVVLDTPTLLIAGTNDVVSTACCSRTQGYWKNHPEAWPVTNFTMGGVYYSLDDAMEVLWTPTRGDATYILAHQLIAAKLNFEFYCDGSESNALSVMALADTWLQAHPLGERPDGAPASEGLGYAVTLDSYNNGNIGPGHCGTLGIDTGHGVYTIPDVMAMSSISGDTNGYTFFQAPPAGLVADWGSYTAVVITAQDPCFNEFRRSVPIIWPLCACIDGDSDGDGQTDREEYCAGTEVFDPNDLFGLQTIFFTNQFGTSIGWTWEFGTNRSYTVQGTLYADSPYYINMATGVTVESFQEIGVLPVSCIYRILCEEE